MNSHRERPRYDHSEAALVERVIAGTDVPEGSIAPGPHLQSDIHTHIHNKDRCSMRGANALFSLVFSLMLFLLTAPSASQVSGEGTFPATTSVHSANTSPVSQQISFIENRGQLRDTDGNPRPDIRYYADVQGTRLYVTNRGISYVFVKNADRKEADRGKEYQGEDGIDDTQEHDIALYRVDMDLAGMNPFARIGAAEKMPGYRNYYHGHCPDGILHVPSYRTVVYEDLYPSIDMVITMREGKVKSEFIVHPGGDPSDIRMRYRGAGDCRLSIAGGIMVTTPLGGLEESRAVSWMENGRPVQSAFRMEDDVARFDIGAYDPQSTLIIDPWSTYHGGTGGDRFNAVCCDAQGNVYASGYTSSTDFPVLAGVQMTSAGGTDVIIAKYSEGGQVLWATYYGGSSTDASATVAPHPAGGIVVGGNTNSADFPVQNALQGTIGGGMDSFIMRITDSGTLTWATYFGGSNTEEVNDGRAGQGLGCDNTGNVYFHSSTSSADLPVIGAYQSALNGPYDAYLIKISASGAHLWSTYFGGSGDEQGKGVGITPQGTIGICGRTLSTDLPLLYEHESVYQGNSQDGYAAEFSSTGQLLWSSYLGGDGFDAARSMTADDAGALYIASRCQSTDMVTVNPMQASLAGSQDIHIIKYAATPTPQNGRSIEWASYLGGSGNDDINRGTIGVNSQGNIVLVGGTSSADFPLKDALQPTIAGGEDLYITVLSKYGTIHWSTFYGGTGGDDAYQGIFTPDNDIVVAGYTSSADFPLEAPAQPTYGGGTDGFLLHLSSQGLVVTPPIAPAGLTANAVSPTRVSLSWTDNSNNETWFIVEYENASQQWITIDSTAANVPMHIVVDLLPETEHRFRVRAANSKYTSDPTNVASATTPPFIAPADLQAEAVSSDAVELSWKDRSDNESGFVIEVNRNLGVWDEVDRAEANDIRHTVLGLQPSTEYTFRLKAIEGRITSPSSNEATATTWKFLHAPTNLTATVITETRVELRWEDNADGENNYEVQQKHESGEWTLVATLPANSVEHTLQGLVPRTHYWFKVRATGDKAASSWSNIVDVLTKTKPSIPLEFSCSAMDHRTVSLTWLRGSENEDGYEIERKTDAADWGIVHTAGPGDGNILDEHLEASTLYWYRIRAVNDVGASDWAEDTAATYPMPVPNQPFGLTATPSSPFSIHVSWIMPDPSFEETFELQWSLTGDEADFTTLSPSPLAGVRAYEHEGLNPETEYFYRIRAVNISGASAWSKIVSATTLREEQKIPVTPFDVTAVALSDTEIRIDWSMPDPTLAESFEIERSLTGDPSQFTRLTPDPEFDVRSYTDDGLKPKTKYWYRLRAYNEHGMSPYSAIVSATTLSEPLSPEFIAAMNTKEEIIPWLEQVRTANDHQLGALRSALGDYPRGYDETAARDLLKAWRAEQPDGVQNAISALERYTLLEQAMLAALGSDDMTPPVPGARETARQAVLAPAICAKDVLALGIAWNDVRELLESQEYPYLDKAMQDMSWSLFDGAQTLFALTGTEQGSGLSAAFATMQRECCSPVELTTSTIPVTATYYQELFLMEGYVRATQPLIPDYAMQTRNIWYSGSFMEAQDRHAEFLDDVRTATQDFVDGFDMYKTICYGLDRGYTISSSITDDLSVFMRKMTVLKPDLVRNVRRATEAADIPTERAQYLTRVLPDDLAAVAVSIFDPSSGFAKSGQYKEIGKALALEVDRKVLDADRDALEALRAKVLEENTNYIDTQYDTLRTLGRASIGVLDRAQRPLLGIAPETMLAQDPDARGDYYRTMGLVQWVKLLRSVLSVSLADYVLDAQNYKVDPLVAEIDTLIGALYGAADGIDAQNARNGSLITLPVLALDAASLAGRAQDGPKRYRLSFSVKNSGGGEATDAKLHVALLSSGSVAVDSPDFDVEAILPNTLHPATMDLDIDPGVTSIMIAVTMSAADGGTWTDIRTLKVPGITTTAEQLPAATVMQLHQNYPNPINPTTTISFTITQPTTVTVDVLDPLGREVARLAEGARYLPGTHSLLFHSGDLPSGVYLYRLRSSTSTIVRRMLLTR